MSDELPPMVVRVLTSLPVDANTRTALNTLMRWAFGLEGTLAMSGLATVPKMLEALDVLALAPGETEEERQKVKATIVERLGVQ